MNVVNQLIWLVGFISIVFWSAVGVIIAWTRWVFPWLLWRLHVAEMKVTRKWTFEMSDATQGPRAVLLSPWGSPWGLIVRLESERAYVRRGSPRPPSEYEPLVKVER